MAGIDARTLQRWNAHEGLTKGDGRPSAVRPAPSHALSAGERQVGCWDMTYLPATVVGRWFHLYLILDLYSRKIVGWEVHANDGSDHAVHLVRRTALAEGIAALAVKPVLHGDNDSTLKATTVLTMLDWLSVKPSYSRPRVSDDNAYAESLFRTAKYRPELPAKGFATLEAAREWGAAFVHWYNVEHKHSGIRYLNEISLIPRTQYASDSRHRFFKPQLTLFVGDQSALRHHEFPNKSRSRQGAVSTREITTMNPSNMAAMAR